MAHFPNHKADTINAEEGEYLPWSIKLRKMVIMTNPLPVLMCEVHGSLVPFALITSIHFFSIFKNF